jgi:hypothetical protein
VAVDGHPFGLLAVEFNLKPNVSDACYQCYQRGGHCKPDDKGELDCLGAKRGINIEITTIFGDAFMLLRCIHS